MADQRPEEEKRDAVNLLYSQSFSGFVISIASSSIMVLSFNNAVLQQQKIAWLIVFLLFILLRFIDAKYWKRKLNGTEYSVTFPYYRFFFFSSFTAVLWFSYVVIISFTIDPFEIAFSLVVISGMAGGAPTVLAGSRAISMSYVGIMLLPSSVYLIFINDGFLSNMGYIGLFFSTVMLFSAYGSASVIDNTIRIRHENLRLIHEMELEQKEIKRINHELGIAYDSINETNSSLEIEVVKRTEEIQRLSNLDPLTRLFNRTAFTSALRSLLFDSEENDFELSILFIDLDGFKQINDALGHEVGDDVLKQVSERLWTLRGDGYIGRWGGDEFIFALPYCDESAALLQAQRIMDAVVSSISVGTLSLNVGASIGISLSPKHGRSAQKLVQYADIAMYEHKRKGGRQGSVFDPILLVDLQENERIREGLRKAVENDELRVVYQPIVNADTGEVASCEALLRWFSEGVLLSPADFLDISERSRLIVELGRWVLQKACLDAVQWNIDRRCKVSINVSVVQLFDDSFLFYLDEALKHSQLAPELLTLEITESTFASNQKYLKGLLEEIKSRGVGLSIDDFGVGYSSMSQLQVLPFDIIKVDKSFVDRIDKSGEAIIKATLYIANELGCHTIAEGVETLEQAKHLKHLGTDCLQGYYFAKPQPFDDIIKIIDKGFVIK